MTAAVHRSTPSDRARLSLDGLSIGDAFGQRFFFPWVVERSDPDNLPDPPWHYTDDTEMSLAIVEILEQHQRIEQTALARRFSQRFLAEPGRGYGAGARELLIRIANGEEWSIASRELFGGGSYGNGGAMRAAPLGAWFADDVPRLVAEARLSAEVTHAHPEGQAGAIAVALAAGWAWRERSKSPNRRDMLSWTVEQMPPSETREGLVRAADTPLDAWPFDVAADLGCGDRITAQDTVPFALWMAAAQLDDYVAAMFQTARVGGDIDTNCAIVGGIVALAVGPAGIPKEWRTRREPLFWDRAP